MEKNRKLHESISDEHELSMNSIFFHFFVLVVHSVVRIHVLGVWSMRALVYKGVYNR